MRISPKAWPAHRFICMNRVGLAIFIYVLVLLT